jgi:hypothetical protein
MRRLGRCLVGLVLIAAICTHASASGVGTAVVNGEALLHCGYWDDGCLYPRTQLQRLTYTGGETANVVTFAYVPSSAAYQDVCLGYGPGSCGAVFSAPDEFVFTDAWTTLYGTGLCRAPATHQVAICDSGNANADPWAGDYFPWNAVDSLPVDVSLGGQNDDFVATIPPLGQEFAFSIDTGWGSDKIVLNDNSGHHWGGNDRISCGPGLDRVTANIDVFVDADCESVTRLT